MARSFDAEPYSELEVAPVESTSNSQPQPLYEGHYRNQAERDAAEKQAVDFGHESPASTPRSPPVSPIPRKPVPIKEPTPVTSPIERDESQETPSHTQDRKRKRKRRRWIVIGVIALVVIAAIAGGVAGGLVGKHSSDKSTPSSAAATSATPSPASPSAPPPSSTTSATPTMSGPAIAMASYAFPTAVSWGAPHLEVYALSQGIYPEWKYREANSTGSENTNWLPSDDGSPAFTTLGGVTSPGQFSIAAVARDTTDVAIYVSGTDLGLWSQFHNDTMVFGPGDMNWQSLGGTILSPPTAVSWASDRVDIFAIGTDYHLWQMWWTAADGWAQSWYGFQSQISLTINAPTVISWAENRYDIFAVGSETQALYHRYFDGASWEPSGDFEKLGGFCTSRPVAVSRSEGFIDVFVRGGDARLWHISFTQGRPTPEQWSNWTQISGKRNIQAEPEAIKWDANNIHLFAWGGDNTLLHKAYNSQDESWTPQEGFEVLGGHLAGPPKAVNDGVNIHVFAYLNDGQLGHKSWNADSNTWSPEAGFEKMGSV